MKKLPGALFSLALPSLSFAQANIEGGFNSMRSWLVGIGLSICGVALAWSAIVIATGRQEGKEKAMGVFVGTIVLIACGGLIALIRGWFGG
jgi:uncharacterized membrane protein YadS